MKIFNKKGEKSEKDLDDLLSMDSKGIKKTLLKTKVKAILITTCISLIVIFMFVFAFSTWRNDRFLNIRDNITSNFKERFEITEPNRYMSIIKNKIGFVFGDISGSTYKVIEGKVVYTGYIDSIYDLWGVGNTQTEGEGYDWNKDEKNTVSLWSPGTISDSLKNVNFYNELGQRRMVFFFPFIDYKDLYRNEFNLLSQIDNRKVAEMAISFDKYYSVEEVQKMMGGVRTTWYWIDSLSQENKNKIIKEKNNGYENQAKDIAIKRVAPEDDSNTIGIKLYNCQGQKIQNSIEEFCFNLYNAKDKSSYNEIKSLLNVSIEYGDNSKIKYDKSKLKIGGVVVTGTIEQLKILKGKSFIKASTIGVFTDKI